MNKSNTFYSIDICILNMIKRQTFRLYPTKEQEKLIQGSFGFSRWVYNYGLEKKINSHKEWIKLSAYDLDKQIALKKKEEWFERQWEYTKWIRQFSLNNLDTAFVNFFRKQNKFPKFKSKHDNNKSYSCLDVKLWDNTIQLPRIGKVKCIIHRQIEWKIGTCTVKQTPTGKYFVSLVVDNGIGLPPKLECKKETALGIDLWIKDFAITSEWTKYENPKRLKKYERRLKIRSRRHNKKVKWSNNRTKSRLELATIHEKVANQRKDYIHKITNQIVKGENQTFVLEDLAIQNMVKNRKLSKAISQVGRWMFKQFITYKSDWCGKNVITIGRFLPSSKMCKDCGNIKHNLTLADRVYICECCKSEYCRDLGSAINIRDFGFSS